MMGAIFIPTFYLHNILANLDKLEGKGKILFICYLMSIVFSIINLTPLFVKDVSPKLNFPYWPIPGVLLHFHLLMFALILFYIYYLLLKSLFTVTGLYKNQMLYLLVATILGFTGGMINYLLWYNIPVKPYANIFVSLYIVIIAYAIAKYRLMDISLVFRRSLAYSLFVGVVTGFLLITVILIEKFFQRFIGTGYVIPTLIAVAILAFVFDLLREKIKLFLDSLVFRGRFGYQKALVNLGETLVSMMNIDDLLQTLVSALKEKMRVERCSVLLWEEASGKYTVKAAIGVEPVTENITFKPDDYLVRTLATERKLMPLGIIVGEELQSMASGEQPFMQHIFGQMYKQMQLIGADICVPMMLQDRLIGFITLSNKKTGAMFNAEDMKILTNLARESSLTIENIRKGGNYDLRERTR